VRGRGQPRAGVTVPEMLFLGVHASKIPSYMTAILQVLLAILLLQIVFFT
jgi:hypothetical protein